MIYTLHKVTIPSIPVINMDHYWIRHAKILRGELAYFKYWATIYSTLYVTAFRAECYTNQSSVAIHGTTV
jgi:hypothetical protein